MKRLFAIGAALVATVFLLFEVREFLAIDTCLDRGGSWDYELGRCDMVNNHGR